MRSTSDFAADLLSPIAGCRVSWGTNDCPNEVAYVIVNTRAPGYCPTCEPHAVGWPHNSNVGRDNYVVVTIDEFNSMRDRGLYTKYSVPSEVPTVCPQCLAINAKTSLDGLPICTNCGYVYNGGQAT